jgi:hypothetical protein
MDLQSQAVLVAWHNLLTKQRKALAIEGLEEGFNVGALGDDLLDLLWERFRPCLISALKCSSPEHLLEALKMPRAIPECIDHALDLLLQRTAYCANLFQKLIPHARNLLGKEIRVGANPH